MSIINLWLVPVSNVPGHQSMAAEMLATAAAMKSASEDFHIFTKSMLHQALGTCDGVQQLSVESCEWAA